MCQSRGRLTAMVISCAVVFGVVVSVLYHLTLQQLRWTDGQVTNVVVLLITTSAGVAALIAQREFSGVADRMVGQLQGSWRAEHVPAHLRCRLPRVHDVAGDAAQS